MKHLVYLVAIVCVGSVAHAFPIFGGAMPEITPSANANCTNFSGTYHGVCERHSVRVDETFTLNQAGCDTISTGDLVIPIGSLFNMSLLEPASQGKTAQALTKSAKLIWSADGKMLQISGTAALDDLSATRAVGAKKLDGQLRLDGSKLTLTMNDEAGTVTCTYDKQ